MNLQLSGTHRKILFVGKDQQQSISELILVQHPLELLTSLGHTLSIVGVDDEDDTLGVLEVMAPERTDLVLSTDIPHCERNVLVLDGLDVEPWKLSATNSGAKTSQARVLPTKVASRRRGIRGCARAKMEDVPMVGMVVTISPSLSLYKMVVLPAASWRTRKKKKSAACLSSQYATSKLSLDIAQCPGDNFLGAASRVVRTNPTIRIRISFLLKSPERSFDMERPMMRDLGREP